MGACHRRERVGSSPRWRGRPWLPPTRCGPVGLIPALAGTTRRRCLTGSRGGSSPRWRGRLGRSMGDAAKWGLIPALAGTTPPPASTGGPDRAHPRAGGDDKGRADEKVVDQGSAPRWRGRHLSWTPHWTGLGLIPALAGTTTLTSPTWCGYRAHPRAGGDDSPFIVPGAPAQGSSPRWRGRHAGGPCHVRGPRLIPALAGTTIRRDRWRAGCWAHPRAGGDDLASPESG